MFVADYHTHCNFSNDCQTPMEDMIKQAVALGLKELALTDHVDYDYPDIAFDFLIDYNEYCKTFFKLKEQYQNQIKLRLGVEIGLQSHLKYEIKKLCTEIDFDFIIASTHVVDRLDLCNGDFYKNKSKNEAFSKYFEDILNNIKIHNKFSVYGHLDYINRYTNYNDNTVNYIDYKNIIDEILKLLIQSGKGIEINTSGYRYKLNQTHPQLSILKRYKELGGEIITVGSDAHRTNDIASHFDIAYLMLKETGFKYITLFEECKPIFVEY